MVYHEGLGPGHKNMGAYLNNGNGWTSKPPFTPTNTLAAYGSTNLGIRFIDLNADGKMDMVYNRWVLGDPSRKGGISFAKLLWCRNV